MTKEMIMEIKDKGRLTIKDGITTTVCIPKVTSHTTANDQKLGLHE